MRKRKKFVYRQIYEENYGPIPVDSEGRTYHIHHIDGNPNNDDPTNLVALSIKDHYDLHLKRGDKAACLALAASMKMSVDELSEMSRAVQHKRIAEGTHQFLDPKFQSTQGKKGYKKAMERRTHFSLTTDFRQIASKRIEDGSSPFLNSEIQRKNVMKGIENGTHSSCKVHTCPHCGLLGKGGAMKKWHFDNCRSKQW